MARPGWRVLALAILWGAVILGVAWLLKGTPQATQVVVILGGASGASLLIVGGGHCRRAEHGHD